MDLSNAKDALDKALASGDRNVIAHALANLSLDYIALGQYALAIECYIEALALFQDSRNPLGMSRALMGMGLAYSSMGQHLQALDCYLLALPILRRIGNTIGVETTSRAIEHAYRALKGW
jgi:tetratricopeptide (TPR) repeat protein